MGDLGDLGDLGGLEGGTAPEDLPLIEPIKEGDTTSNFWGTLTSTLPKRFIPRTHLGNEFNPDCYAKKNPEVAKITGNNKEKLTQHWIDIGSKEAADAECSDVKTTAEERFELLKKLQKTAEEEKLFKEQQKAIEAEKVIERERQRVAEEQRILEEIEGRKQNCAATDKFWVNLTKTCDGTRHKDGRQNLEPEKCKQQFGHYEQPPNTKPYCNRFRNEQNNIKPANEKCNMRNNHWENGKCDRTKNVDGSAKTDADYCTGLNNYYKDGICDVKKDRDGKEKSEQTMCNEDANYWNNGVCDIKKYPDGTLKGKQEICQSVFNGRLNITNGLCLDVDGQYPYNYAQMEEYLIDKQLKFRDFPLRIGSRNMQTVDLKSIQGGNKPKSLTLYYADWCPHCHDMMSDWNKLGKQHKGIKIEKFEEKETNFKVDGFPTIIFRDGSKVEKYEGERTKKAIVSYLKNKLK